MKSLASHSPNTANSLTALTNRAATLLSFKSFNPKKHSPRILHAILNDGNPPPFELFEACGADRVRVEVFIHRCYAENFDAHVDAFMPHLFGLRDARGVICGAFGLRTASRRLFLEQYLQSPIETAIAFRSGHAVERHSIVEIGHFSGAFAGAAREMIRLLTQRLRDENYAWVTFTGTTVLRNAFSRMGLPLLDIAPADVECLPADARNCWGNYYEHAPRVMAGEICTGYEALAQTPSLSTEVVDRCA